MASSADNISALDTLEKTIKESSGLIQRWVTACQTDSALNTAINVPDIKPLALLRDAAKLLKAQTTKLSLLVLNKPFSPAEITFIINEMAKTEGGCLVGLMTAQELCTPEKYTAFLHKICQTAVCSTLNEILKMLAEIPYDDYGIGKTQGRDTLASTGIIWEACDKMISIADQGLALFAHRKVADYQSLVKDAVEELETSIEDDDLGEGSADIELTRTALKKVKLIALLFPPLLKRRVKIFPSLDASTSPETLPTPQQVKNMDTMIYYARLFHEETDEIAGSLYDDDASVVQGRLKIIGDYAKSVLDVVGKNWQGEDDEFTRWAAMWLMKWNEE